VSKNFIKRCASIPKYIVDEGSLARAQLHHLEGSGLSHLHPLIQQPDANALTEHLATPKREKIKRGIKKKEGNTASAFQIYQRHGLKSVRYLTKT